MLSYLSGIVFYVYERHLADIGQSELIMLSYLSGIVFYVYERHLTDVDQ
jgi:uncharacterized membrane protein